jgi:hypothetical protein
MARAGPPPRLASEHVARPTVGRMRCMAAIHTACQVSPPRSSAATLGCGPGYSCGSRRCCCPAESVRARRRPSSVVTPWDSNSVASKSRFCRSRSASTARVVGRALGAAVPGSVVFAAVPVVLAVDLVVLAVIGDQVVQGEPSWQVTKLAEATGRPASAAYRCVCAQPGLGIDGRQRAAALCSRAAARWPPSPGLAGFGGAGLAAGRDGIWS